MMKILIAFSLLIFLLGCQKATQWETAEWRGESETAPQPVGMNEIPRTQHFRIQNAAGIESVQLQLQNQQIKGIEIENAFFKQLIVNGKTSFVSYQWLDKFPVQLQADALVMRANQKRVLQKIHRKHSILKSLKIAEKPKLVLRSENLNPELYWKLVLIGDQGHLTAFYFDKNLNLKDQVRQGSGFEARASIYPVGPLKSSLQDVVLKNLLGDQTLTSRKIRVSTQAHTVAKAENNQFIFPITDIRFEQVQVFYYLNKSLTWFEDKFQFVLPGTLEAMTSIGFPEKTNTAFYYQNKIRLGDGDDETYSKIPLDPSIVIHESVHAVIDQMAKLPYVGIGGSINEAFADYFAAAQLDNPLMGEIAYKKAPFKRNLENEFKKQDIKNGLYHDSQVFSGLLWSLRQELGSGIGDQLAWQILAHLTPASNTENFVKELNIQIGKLSDEQQNKAIIILKNKGWL